MTTIMITVNNITKIYDGKTVLDNFGAEFGAGAYCVTGASGTGKTTLLHIIMGLVKQDGGEVLFNAQRITHNAQLPTPSASRPPLRAEGELNADNNAKFAAVFQEDRLCENLSAVKNVALVCPKKFPKEKIIKELTLVGLGGDLDKQTMYYSGGMKRRVAIVRALITDADIIIMDEPLKGLDDKLKVDIISYIKERVKDKIFIFVSHDKTDAISFGAELLTL